MKFSLFILIFFLKIIVFEPIFYDMGIVNLKGLGGEHIRMVPFPFFFFFFFFFLFLSC